MNREGIGGKIYNDYNAGHYLQFHLKGSSFYIDGTCLSYPSWVFMNQLQLSRGGENWRKYLDEDVDAIVIQWGKYRIPFHQLSDKWSTVYWDDVWVVMVPRIAKNEPLISRYDDRNGGTFTNPASFEYFVKKGDREILKVMFEYLEKRNKERPDIKVAYLMRANLEGRTGIHLLRKAMNASDEKLKKALLKEASTWLIQAENHYTKGLPHPDSLWQRGVVRLWQGKIEEAKKDLVRSLRIGVCGKRIKREIETYLNYFEELLKEKRSFYG